MAGQCCGAPILQDTTSRIKTVGGACVSPPSGGDEHSSLDGCDLGVLSVGLDRDLIP
jgi:hypothetical protein